VAVGRFEDDAPVLPNGRPLIGQLIGMASRVHPKYAPVFEQLPERDHAALPLYFLPHRFRKDTLQVTRPGMMPDRHRFICPTIPIRLGDWPLPPDAAGVMLPAAFDLMVCGRRRRQFLPESGVDHPRRGDDDGVDV